MRYWVYKDAQILGPLALEDLAQGRLRADTLVCEEDASGERDMDWRCAEEVPELSGLYLTGEAPPSILERMGFEDSLLERLQFEAIGTETGASQGEWLSGVFGPAALRADTQDIAAELAASRKRVQELTAKLESLTRLPQPDASPGIAEAAALQAPASASVPEPPIVPILRQSLSVPPTGPAAVSLPPLQEPSPALETPPMPVLPQPEPESSEQAVSKHNVLKLPDQASKQGVKLGAPKSFLSVRKKAPPSAEAVPETPTPQSLPETVSSEPPKAAAPESLEALGSKRNILKLSGQTPKKGVKLGATKSFISVRKEITQPPAQAVTPAPSPAPIPTPVPTPVPTPAPVSMTPGLPTTEVPRAAEPPPMPILQPPIPMMAPSSVAAPPATMTYSGFFSSQPSPAAGPQPASGPAAVSATDEAMVRLAKPQAAPASDTLEPKPKRGEKTFLIISALLVVSLVAAGLMFFNDSKSIKSAVNMGDDQEPLGTAPVEDEASGPEPAPEPALSPAPVAPPAEPFPQAAAPAEPAPEEVPAAAPIVTVQDERPAAIDLVKGFPLDGDRGTVGRWLQYSFTASPGFNEKWDAGAVEGSTYLVQYTVQDSGKSMRPAITYLFEADVARRTVRGKNPAARELLSGSQAPVKTVRKPRARRAAPAAIPPKQPPLLPLPSDADLLPPSEEGASFHSDMVQPGL